MRTHTTNNVNHCGRNDMTDKLTSFKRILQTYTNTHIDTHTHSYNNRRNKQARGEERRRKCENATTAKQVE